MSFHISLSDVRSRHHPSGDIYTVFVLAHHFYLGIFHYQVDVKISPVASISVKLLAMRGVGPRTDNESEPLLDTGVGESNASTWAELGSVGLRGVWVSESATDCKVVAFTTCPSKLCSAAQLSREGTSNEPPAESVPHLGEKVVLDIKSDDLGDECKVYMCAISEYTGRIALGLRTGRIYLI
ncbi:hypothetical protein PAXINDRAFT_182719 [Paxillus involutus ATCC 200175]|uniref:Unplaced genomic scaffold PAXINscaffold_1089, whole genome shotgun sequence n=1 Tax=Paxillus involutus ATCC 200175 TaxID=664439 RepID=A0A0C9SMJ2_PAXIN|nr:hypothetical protein PAXINDRAFT_182719 [Paxillus involutus ATCC 200175]